MTVDVVTLFPGMFCGPVQETLLARARRDDRFSVRVHDLRRWGVGPHRQVDDTPYGGGGGMVLMPAPIFAAVDWIRATYPAERDLVALLSPQGRRFEDGTARRLASYDRLILVCGRYEGVDERVREHLADEEISVGDFVLSGGELPAMLVIEAISRFLPGVLGGENAADTDSFADGRLESPYYTRPALFRGARVPDVLLSGDHAAIARWREDAAQEATLSKRPDLLDRGAAERRSGA